jgi:hypothetical protein
MKRMTMPWTIAVAVLAVVLVTASVANAAPIVFSSRVSFDAAYTAPTLTEGWDGLAAGTAILNGSTVNGVTYNSNTGGADVLGGYFNTTNPNQLTGHTRGGSGWQFGDTLTMTFPFAVSAFGIDFNTFAAANGAFKATTNMGEVITSFYDPFPSASTGQFLGFSTSMAFTSITIEHSLNVDSYGLDSMRAQAAVPDAGSSLLLLGMSLAGLRAWRKRIG